MNCPYCGGEMQLGYIQCRDGVSWTPRKHLLASASGIWGDSVPLCNGAAENSSAVYAFRCAGCRKVIIDCAGRTEE